MTITAKIADVVAEFTIVVGYDLIRETLGHDYGNGQRHRELVRLRAELRALGFDAGELELELVNAGELVVPEVAGILEGLDVAALRVAFDRIAGPRRRRLEEEGYRRDTPATRRTRRAWARLEGELENLEAEAFVPPPAEATR